jgi:flagellar motility protein MotE (MotC chaperone)
MKSRVILALVAILFSVGPVLAQSLVDESQISSVEERRILVSIEQEYEKLAEREADLDSRELQLKTLQKEVDKKLAAMQELREELVKLLDRKNNEEGKRVGELSKIYEKMDPAKAAYLIKELDTQLAIEILIGIKKKTAGRILDSLDAETATELSKAFTDIPVKDRSGY